MLNCQLSNIKLTGVKCQSGKLENSNVTVIKSAAVRLAVDGFMVLLAYWY